MVACAIMSLRGESNFPLTILPLGKRISYGTSVLRSCLLRAGIVAESSTGFWFFLPTENTSCAMESPVPRQRDLRAPLRCGLRPTSGRWVVSQGRSSERRGIPRILPGQVPACPPLHLVRLYQGEAL